MEDENTNINSSLDPDEPQVTLRDHAIKYGVILGLIGVIIGVLIYIVDITFMANLWFGLFMLVLSLVIVIYGGIDYRKQIGGFIPFGKAFTHGFLTFLIGGIIGTIWNILFYTVIDPDAVNVIAEAGVEQSRAIAERFGASGPELDAAMEEAREDAIDRFTVGGLMMQFLWGLIAYVIFSLISGAIVKRNPPESDVV